MHSLLAKGRLLYTHDETIADLCERLRELGARDTEIQLLRAATARAAADLQGAQVARSRAATSTTPRSGSSTPPRRWPQIEVIGAGLVADREVIPQAMKLNPALFETIYTDLLNAKKTATNVAGGARRGRSLPGRAGAVAVRAGHRLPARGRRSALVQRDRESLQAALRRQRA